MRHPQFMFHSPFRRSQALHAVKVCAIVVGLTGSSLLGQATSVAPTQGLQGSGDTGFAVLPLPLPRPLGRPPSVSNVGFLSVGGGMFVLAPITASLALEDLDKYERQLDALFPWSAEAYPADSLHTLRLSRAAGWLTRLRTTRGDGVDGRQRLAFAQVAFRAEQDTLARRMIDARLAELSSMPAERSLTLASAIEIFADPTQVEDRLLRNLPVAQAYTTMLLAVPSTGYRTRADSVNVHERKAYATLALLKAGAALRRPSILLPIVDQFLAVIPSLPLDERTSLVRWQFPHQAVVTALNGQAGRSKLDSIKAQLLRIVLPRDKEWPAHISIEQRTKAGAQYQQLVLNDFAALDLLGQPAPPVFAHAWLNTPDSAYSPTPRSHSLDDGIIRVLVIGSRDNELLPVLNRVQQQFSRKGPHGVEILFVTETRGNAGPDVLGPSDEVAWLRSYFTNIRHVSIPIALWAGEKNSNEYGWHLPTSSPVPQAYDLATRFGNCLIVDGHGRIRTYYELRTRTHERELISMLTALRNGTADRADNPSH